MVVAAFVAPFLLPATARFVATAAALPNVSLGVITAEPVERLSPELKQLLDGHWRVDDALDPQQLVEAVRGLSQQMGPVERLVGALEQLQVPMAYARKMLGLDGWTWRPRSTSRDKSRMKSVLRAAGVPCARHQLVTHPDEALAFAEAVGFPLVAKPPAGAGAQATYRLDDLSCAARLAARRYRPAPRKPGLLEEFLVGDEHTFDSVTVGGETVFSSISDYQPTPLEVLRQPWIQWTVVLPREQNDPRYERIWKVGPAALRALGVRDAVTHMEWFHRPDGSIAVSEVAARPPGAQISSMLGYVHEVDFYRVWAELVILGTSIRPSANTPQVPRTSVARVAAGSARFTVSRSCSARSAIWSSRPGFRDRATGLVELRGRGVCHRSASRDRGGPGRRAAHRRPASGRARGGAMNLVMISPGYPVGDVVLHPGIGRGRGHGHRPR